MKAAGRPRLVLGLAGLSLAGLVWALAGLLGDVTARDLEEREATFVEAADRALQADADRLARLAATIQRSPEFAEIVDGGGAAVRPERLFSTLSGALPAGSGWGAVFFEPSGRPVGWAGEAGALEPGPDDGPALSATFHVTRFSVSHRSVRRSGVYRRGVLVVSRRYPTGILRPDLIEMLSLSGGPTTRRLRAVAAPGALVRFFLEPTSGGRAEADVRRQRARAGTALATVSLLVLGLVVRRRASSGTFSASSLALPIALVAARLTLLLGSPRGRSGLFSELVPSGGALGLSLLATPADVFVTGVVALLVLRLVAAGGPGAGLRRLGGAVTALALLPAVVLLSRSVGLDRADLFDDLSLVPETGALLMFRVGWIALVSALLGLAAAGLRGLAPEGSTKAGVAVGLGLALVSLGFAGTPFAVPVSLAGAALLALCAPAWDADRSVGASRAVLLVLAAVAIVAAGVHDGKIRHLDAALERAEVEDLSPEAERVARGPESWSQRLSRPLEPWLPAGDRTLPADLARALWIRGADATFPTAGDVLKLRDDTGRIVSSFGLVRPGVEDPALEKPATVPVPGLRASWAHLDHPRAAERDPLLSAVALRERADRVAVEHLVYDAAGRPSGSSAERQELPPRLLEEARRRGSVASTIDLTDGTRRIRVRSGPRGFTAFLAVADGPGITFGSAAAAGEGALLVVVPLLVFRRPRRGSLLSISPFAFLRTFRARLVALVLVLGAVPIAGSVAVVKLALERQSSDETMRRARVLLGEARRSWHGTKVKTPGPEELNEAAAVIGADVLLYRDGRLVAASRALPVAAGIASDRLSGEVAQALAEGRAASSSVSGRFRALPGRVVEAAEPLSADGRDALAIVLAEDEAGRVAVDALVLFAIFVALGAFFLGLRAALSLSRPVSDLIDAAEHVGAGESMKALERPAAEDLARLVSAFEDMARRVGSRTELLARERAAALGLLQNLTAAVLLFRDADGSVILANPAADEVLPPGDTLSVRVREPRFAPLREALDEARRRPSPFETRMALSEGPSERVFRVVVAALPFDGDERRSILLLEDLTDFMRADRLGAWVDAARAIAHDIKNPLTPIRLAAERLLRFEARGERPPGGVALNILRQVEILKERTGRLLRFSNPAALDSVPFDAQTLKELLTDVASDYAESEKVTVEVRVAGELPVVLVDRPVIRDVLTNFVINAVEAMDEQDRAERGRIVLSAEPVEQPSGRAGVLILCEDDGPGVPAEQLDRLFTPAFSTKSRGSGMGLAAARRAIERHGGSVLARKRETRGLAIGFILPSENPPALLN